MLEPIENQYKMIGHIARSHGVEGEVLIIPDIYAPTLFDSIALARIENTRGDLIPARPESVRVQEKNDRLSFFVKFEHVTDRTQADMLKDFAVYADLKAVQHLFDQTENSISVDFRSFEIWTNGKYFGLVSDIIENPAHPILQVIGDGKEQLLIPLVEEYICNIDQDHQKIYCQNLEQLKGL